MFFTTKELKAFSQSYREARAEYNESQQDLVRNIQQIASTYAPVFELIEEALAEIDALLSLAHASVRPFPLLAVIFETALPQLASMPDLDSSLQSDRLACADLQPLQTVLRRPRIGRR